MIRPCCQISPTFPRVLSIEGWFDLLIRLMYIIVAWFIFNTAFWIEILEQLPFQWILIVWIQKVSFGIIGLLLQVLTKLRIFPWFDTLGHLVLGWPLYLRYFRLLYFNRWKYLIIIDPRVSFLCSIYLNFTKISLRWIFLNITSIGLLDFRFL